jgi:hypothetical protein
MLNSSPGPQFPLLNEPHNVFDGAFQQPAPWTSLAGSNPNGTPANLTLPFPASNTILANRTSSTLMNVNTVGGSLASRVYDKMIIESNDDDDDDGEESYDHTNPEPTVASPKADALHKVAWGTKREPEPKSLTPRKCKKRSVNSIRTPREPTRKDPPTSNKSDSSSESIHSSKGRLNHDLTEKR